MTGAARTHFPTLYGITDDSRDTPKPPAQPVFTICYYTAILYFLTLITEVAFEKHPVEELMNSLQDLNGVYGDIPHFGANSLIKYVFVLYLGSPA